MAREAQRSYPMLEPRDVPNAISPADLDAHLRAHQLFDERFRDFRKSFEERLKAVENRRDSTPVVIEKSANRWVFRAKGGYAVALGVLALIAFGIWLLLR